MKRVNGGQYYNGKYYVGCNGATIYVYNNDEEELAKLRDINYVYTGAFKPDSNIFVAKSGTGRLAIYDLDELKLIKKFRYGEDGAQDGSFAFSPDGKYFYNIERKDREVYTRVTIYETEGFTVVDKLFDKYECMGIDYIDFTDKSNECYMIGRFYERGNNEYPRYYVWKLVDNIIQDKKKLNVDTYDNVCHYMHTIRDNNMVDKIEGQIEISLKRIYEENLLVMRMKRKNAIFFEYAVDLYNGKKADEDNRIRTVENDLFPIDDYNALYICVDEECNLRICGMKYEWLCYFFGNDSVSYNSLNLPSSEKQFDDIKITWSRYGEKNSIIGEYSLGIVRVDEASKLDYDSTEYESRIYKCMNNFPAFAVIWKKI